MRRFQWTTILTLLSVIFVVALAGAFAWLRITGPFDNARMPFTEPVWREQGIVVRPLHARPGGVQAGDVLVAIDGQPVAAWGQALFDWRSSPPPPQIGQTVIYSVLRDGSRIDLPIVLEAYPIGAVLADSWSTSWGIYIGMFLIQVIITYVAVRRPDDQAARGLFLATLYRTGIVLCGIPNLQAGDLVDRRFFWLCTIAMASALLLYWGGILQFALFFPRAHLLITRYRNVKHLSFFLPTAFLFSYILLTRPWRSPPELLTFVVTRAMGQDILSTVFATLTVLCLISGYIHARQDPIVRLQARLVMFSCILLGISVTVLYLLPFLTLGYSFIPRASIGLLSVPVVVALVIAILRYRLFDIDIIINRTLVYTLLSLCIIGIYVLVVGYLGALFQTGSSLAISLVATGLVAVLFQPLREYLQRAVNRVMYGERDDPYTVIARLDRRLETAFAPEAILPTIVETVAQALKLPYVAVTLKQETTFTPAAVYGQPAGDLVTFPLIYQSELIGQLLLAPRSAGEALSTADRRLLQTIAQHAGIAAYTVRLTADLQHSRERLVMAREEERRRLRRDLHDGLGPLLSTHMLQLELVRNLLAARQSQVVAHIDQLIGETEEAIASIRHIAYALRPPALDELGLVSALREYVAHASHESEDRLSSTQRLQIVIDAGALPSLPAAVEVATYRIALEAITNVVRHAHAQTCTLRLWMEDRGLHLEICDDGTGLPPDYHAGIGLTSMRERAAELGGTCTIQAGPSGGTCVQAWLPAAPARESPASVPEPANQEWRKEESWNVSAF